MKLLVCVLLSVVLGLATCGATLPFKQLLAHSSHSQAYSINSRTHPRSPDVCEVAPSSRVFTPLSMRSSMLSSKWISDTRQSSSNSMKFLREFPRKKPNGEVGLNQLQRLGGPAYSNGTYPEPVGEYISGMAFMIGIPVVFAFLSLVMWLGFCVSRCWCNCCGRHATKLYSDGQINCHRVLSCLVIAVMGVLTAFGWSGNVQVSTGMDSCWIAADTFANYAYEYMGLLSDAYGIDDDAVRLAAQFQQTFDLVPPASKLNSMQSCMSSASTGVFTAESNFMNAMNGIDSTMASALLGVSDLYLDMSLLNSTAALLQRDAPTTAALLNNLLNNINQSFATLPDQTNAQTYIDSFYNVSSTYNFSVSSVAHSSLSLFSGSSVPLLVLCNDLYWQYLDIEYGVSTLSNLTALADMVRQPNSNDTALTLSLVALNNTITNDFPDSTFMYNQLVQFQTSVNALNGIMQPLINSLTVFQSQSARFVNLLELNSTLTTLSAYVISQQSVLLSSLNAFSRVNQSIAALNDIATFYSDVQTANQAVSSVALIDFNQIITTLQAFNNSISQITCAAEVFNSIIEMNSSVLIFPSPISSIVLPSAPVLSEQSSNMQQLINNISIVQHSLITAQQTVNQQPDWTSLNTSILTIERSRMGITNFSDFHQLFTQLQDLNTSFTALAPLASYITQLNTMISTLNTLNLNELINQLSSLNTQLQSLPDLIPYVSSLLDLKSSLTSLPSLISRSIPSDLHNTSLATSIESFRDAVDARPDSNALTPILLSLNTTMHNITHPNILNTTINNHINAVQMLPAATLKQSYDSFATAVQHQPMMLSLISTSSLLSYSTSFTSFTQLNNITSIVGDMVLSYGVLLSNSFLAILFQPGAIVNLTDAATIADQLESLKAFNSYWPDMPAEINQGKALLATLSNTLDWMNQKKIYYQNTREEYQRVVNAYDGIRLLIFNLFVLSPFAFSFLLLISAVWHYGCPSMCLGLMFFPLFSLFFIMAAIQMPISVALADHCYNTTGEVKIQTEGRVVDRSTLAFFNLQRDISVPDTVDYFTMCVGSPPEFLGKLRNPRQVLADLNLNITQMKFDVESSIGLTFAPRLQSNFDDALALEDRVVKLFGLTVDKMNCTRTSLIYDAALTSVCSDFAPYFALTTCVFLLTALCIVPGICLGIMGYKRFDPINRAAGYRQAATEEGNAHIISHEGWN